MKTLVYPRIAVAALAALTIGLSGCSSKPEASDIAKGLADEFQCPILEINAVKKTDGVDRGNHVYEVSYTFQVALQGGKSTAAKLLPELDTLNERLARGRLQHERASQAAAVAGTGNNSSSTDAATGRAFAEVLAVKKRLAEIQPCELPNARFAIDRIRAAAQPQADSPHPQIPIGLMMRGTSLMVKAENGWRFAEPPRFDINAEMVMRDGSMQQRSSAVLWTEFAQADGAFVATVPSEGECRFVETDSKTGQSWWQCSYETTNTNMDVWFTKLAGSGRSSDSDAYLEAVIKDIAERHNEQISDMKPIKFASVLAKDITAKSTNGERRIRIFVTGKYEVQAIASPKPGAATNHDEMEKFIVGVKPAFI